MGNYYCLPKKIVKTFKSNRWKDHNHPLWSFKIKIRIGWTIPQKLEGKRRMMKLRLLDLQSLRNCKIISKKITNKYWKIDRINQAQNSWFKKQGTQIETRNRVVSNRLNRMLREW